MLSQGIKWSWKTLDVDAYLPAVVWTVEKKRCIANSLL